MLTEFLTLFRQEDMKALALFTGLTLRANMQRPTVGIEVAHS